jgi:hypothetical protein
LFSASTIATFDWQPKKFGLGDLSAFSQVCSYVRGAVERAMYRDIRVSADGWMYADRHIRSSRGLGCIRCLIRTLKRRPILRQYARSVFLEMDRDSEGHKMLPLYRSSGYDDELRRTVLLLLKSCTSLQRIFVTGHVKIPSQKYFQSLNITAFGMKYSRLTVQVVLETYKGLLELHIQDATYLDWSIFKRSPSHTLKKLRLQFSHFYRDSLATIFHKAVEACADSVEELHISFSAISHYHHGRCSSIKSPKAGANLRILRLDNFPILDVPLDPAACTLNGLQRLEQLHLTGYLRIPEEAFALFPPTLRSVYFSADRKHGYSNRELATIITDLQAGLRKCSLPITRLEIYRNYSKKPPKCLKSGFKLLRDDCVTDGIPFQINTSKVLVQPEIRIICMSFIAPG